MIFFYHIIFYPGEEKKYRLPAIFVSAKLEHLQVLAFSFFFFLSDFFNRHELVTPRCPFLHGYYANHTG